MDADTGACQPACQPFGERHHPRLGRRVGRAAAGQQPRNAGDVDTVPAPASIIAGNAARVSSITAVTLTSSWDCSRARSAVQNSPDVAKPALFTSTSTPAANRSATLPRSADSARSAGSTSTARPPSPRNSAASSAEPIGIARHQHQVVAVGGIAACEAFADPDVGPVIRATRRGTASVYLARRAAEACGPSRKRCRMATGVAVVNRDRSTEGQR